jgi:hypothetical protein
MVTAIVIYLLGAGVAAIMILVAKEPAHKWPLDPPEELLLMCAWPIGMPALIIAGMMYVIKLAMDKMSGKERE